MFRATSELNTLIPLLPMILIALTSLIVLLTVFVRQLELLAKYLSFIGIVISLVLIFTTHTESGTLLRYSYIHDGLAVLSNFAILATLLFVVLSSFSYDEKFKRKAEYYSLLMMSSVGGMVLSGGGSLISSFIGLELLSIPLYILSAYLRDDENSFEAGVKYFLIGSFASAVFLMGVAITFGETGYFLLKDIKTKIQISGVNTLLQLGMVFLFTGIFFKLAIVPFHIWAPDVYQGAPAPVAGYMSVVVKVAVFSFTARMFQVLPLSSHFWTALIGVFVLLTVFTASLIGIVQNNIKRLLAYSSIVHAGFVLLGLMNLEEGYRSAVFYLVIYAFMNFGAFTIITATADAEEKTSLEDYKGLFYRNPLLSLAVVIFFFALTGIPPTAGFWAKFYVFKNAIQAGYLWLVVLALMGAVISAYYYLKVIIYAFMYEPEKEGSYYVPFSAGLTLFILSVLVMFFGIFPDTLFVPFKVEDFLTLGF